MTKVGFRALLLLLCTGLFIGASAQTSTVGSISGTLRDPQGAPVPNVEVVVTEQATGQSRHARTNDDGFFTITSLPVGRYNLAASPAGFKRIEAPNLDVNVSGRVVLDLTLEVGEVTKRLRALGGVRLPVPKGIDPYRVRPDRKGMKGR